MSSGQLVVPPGNRSRALKVDGVKVTVPVSDAASSARQVMLQSGGEGAGSPPHRDDWDESFDVTRGQVRFTCNGAAATCLEGALVLPPFASLL
jgi:quercetin dioxygenase-like cupin family protein